MNRIRGIFVLFVAVLAVLLGGVDYSVAQRRVERSEQVVMVHSVPYYLHTAKRWQEISDIAAAYGISVAQIYSSNPSLGARIKSGQTILVPVSGGAAPSTPSIPQVQPPVDTAPVPQSADMQAVMPQGNEMQSAVDNARFLGSPTQAGSQLHRGATGFGVSTQAQQYGISLDRTQVMGLDSLSGGYAVDSDGGLQYPQVQFGLTKPVNPNLPLEVAVLLPFDNDPIAASRFVGFLNGMTMALDNMPQGHRGVNLRVLATNKTPERISQIIVEGGLDGVDLIIGPVYPAEFEVAALYSAVYRVPIISPLGPTGAADHPYVVEVAPSDANVWDKFGTVFNKPGQNVILVNHTTLTDSVEFMRLQALLPPTTKVLNYVDKNTEVDTLASFLARSSGSENLLVVPINNEPAVEEVLARFNSINTNRRYKLSAVGMSSWSRFSRIDMDLFFRMGVMMPSTYYHNRMDEPMTSFYSNYIKKHSVLPSLYAMRGYDVATLGIGMMMGYGDTVMYELIRDTPTPLQTPYLFDQATDHGKLRNIDWSVLTYHPNFTITAN